MARKKSDRCYRCRRLLENEARKKHGYCLRCHAKYTRDNRPKYHELTDGQRNKISARSYANTYLKRGKIKKEPCINCGSKESQMHHDDYNKPLEVTWMCRTCHLDIHKTFR